MMGRLDDYEVVGYMPDGHPVYWDWLIAPSHREDHPMRKHLKAIAITVAGLAVAALLVVGPLRSAVNGDAHHLDACLTGANPTACHG